MPHSASLSATICEVRVSWNASSGLAWMSRRMWIRSAWNRRSISSGSFFMGSSMRRRRALDAQARIDCVVQQVDNEIDDDEEQRDQAQVSRHHRHVGNADGLD